MGMRMCMIVTWQQLKMVESTVRTQRSDSSEPNSNKHDDSDILTVYDGREDEERGETDASSQIVS